MVNDPDNDGVEDTPEHRLLDALFDRLERALELAASAGVFDRLTEVAELCEDAARLARAWPEKVPPGRPPG